MSFRSALELELRVAFSRKAQPVWFRVVKWAAIIWATVYFWGASSFWWWAAALFAVSIGLHLLWRVKTKRWTQPWMGWNDVEVTKRSTSSPW